mmetsp:Transcript_4379/g.13249  ORF Transcript_4379/g.13249 Transcript_4379/m.13249 type:complete len:985 (-) Transcript_4379:519-3473(-)
MSGPLQIFVPVEFASQTLAQLRTESSSFRETQALRFEDARGRVEEIQLRLKTQYSAFYGKHVADIREASKERVDAQLRLCAEREALLRALTIAETSAQVAARASSEAQSASELARFYRSSMLLHQRSARRASHELAAECAVRCAALAVGASRHESLRSNNAVLRITTKQETLMAKEDMAAAAAAAFQALRTTALPRDKLLDCGPAASHDDRSECQRTLRVLLGAVEARLAVRESRNRSKLSHHTDRDLPHQGYAPNQIGLVLKPPEDLKTGQKDTPIARLVEQKNARVAEIVETRAYANEAERCANLAQRLAMMALVRPREVPASSESDARDTARVVGQTMKESVVKGTALWKGGKRAECCNAYKLAAREALSKLPLEGTRGWTVNGNDLLGEVRTSLKSSLSTSETQTAARGAVALRKTFDKVMELLATLMVCPGEPTISHTDNISTPTCTKSLQAPADVAQLTDSLAVARKRCARAAQRAKKAGSFADQLDTATGTAPQVVSSTFNVGTDDPSGGKSASIVQESSMTNELRNIQSELATSRSACDTLRYRVKELELSVADVDTLRARAGKADDLTAAIQALEQQKSEVESRYKIELTLRKKYWNMIEDMKGKIRVFARCRPMAKYEVAKKCSQVVHLIDERIITVDTVHGPKEFTFDSAFAPVLGDDAGQSAIFQDTNNLIQSCLDGYNVCIFAYGQTGSGKTFTMTGVRDSPELRGITPRAIHTLFDSAKAMTKQCDVRVRSYFLELYNDALVDLYEKVDNPRGHSAPPKLEIKLSSKKMVFVKGAVIKEANSADELLNLFDAGNSKRHVGATKMNAESSRSHSIFAILVEVYNHTTRKTSVGKLSLVDLAGSERADKTGATDARLKEAQNINKSLSALGDVISALSNGEKFIPYRNNKLTLVMQDSLGGNAKTLMFVNISPADYNVDETITSLKYASRVKLIQNTANKNAETEEIAQLKAIIKDLKTGGSGDVSGVEIMI